ncbi:hypothetical protein CK203_087520 [Vitis vinifera]|uniref:Uncharacterized protein n=1 Tax=Vitis vinifera TaxID=29760 RepID=A0A438DA79_VITVI|nr:hypothetical protein CK203_087520 [Vitis vinifera]
MFMRKPLAGNFMVKKLQLDKYRAVRKDLTKKLPKRVKHRKSRLIERVELKEFSLGSCPPNLGLNGTHWSTSGDQ